MDSVYQSNKATLPSGQMTTKQFLNKLKNPVKIPDSSDPIYNPKIKKINDPDLSDNVNYGFLNTITYQRGIADNAPAPDEELKGNILHTVNRTIRPSDGGEPPTLPRGTIGERKI